MKINENHFIKRFSTDATHIHISLTYLLEIIASSPLRIMVAFNTQKIKLLFTTKTLYLSKNPGKSFFFFFLETASECVQKVNIRIEPQNTCENIKYIN